ncbi:hypothetical protein NQ318_015740 [Aromia moschata]|uniref:Mab-21-like nucleotidyltransferase domain-containing protein n=1 Tax=Aromia moschata TaxID=1265417 RepID=A0AAV8X5C0_9CUCU|nr:hypothetical protein NQ318_015740 [Aromia moschata]
MVRLPQTNVFVLDICNYPTPLYVECKKSFEAHPMGVSLEYVDIKFRKKIMTNVSVPDICNYLTPSYVECKKSFDAHPMGVSLEYVDINFRKKIMVRLPQTNIFVPDICNHPTPSYVECKKSFEARPMGVSLDAIIFPMAYEQAELTRGFIAHVPLYLSRVVTSMVPFGYHRTNWLLSLAAVFTHVIFRCFSYKRIQTTNSFDLPTYNAFLECNALKLRSEQYVVLMMCLYYSQRPCHYYITITKSYRFEVYNHSIFFMLCYNTGGLNKFLIKKNYLSTAEVLRWMESVVTIALNEFQQENGYYILNTKYGIFQAKVCKGGPAFTLKVRAKGGKRIEMDIDLVPCFVFWERNVASSIDMSEKSMVFGIAFAFIIVVEIFHIPVDVGMKIVVEPGELWRVPDVKPEFFIVPKPLRDVNNSVVYWRLSFQEQERVIMDGREL